MILGSQSRLQIFRQISRRSRSKNAAKYPILSLLNKLKSFHTNYFDVIFEPFWSYFF